VEKNALVVVGSVAFDDLEMPYGTFENVVGGAATYSAFAASAFAPVRLVGVVGKDFPEPVLADLRSRGVDTQGVERKEGLTFRWRGRYSTDLASRVSLDTQLNVFSAFAPALPASYRQAPYLLLGNIHPNLQASVLEQAGGARFVAADTMNFWISGEPKALAEVLKRVHLLMINDEEARELSGIHSLPKAAADIRKRGPRHVIIKRGEHGALLFDDAGAFFVPAYPLEEVRDPTGAGDTFAGGLMGYLAQQGEVMDGAASEPHATVKSLRKAMFYGAALASFCVEDVGTKRIAAVTKGDIYKRIRQFADLVDAGGPLTP
jgi:sugar/nucleoside kinase (ribokinase family)